MIKDYSTNPRSDGYRGIRVYHSVDGKLIQKYFHHTKMAEAIAFNEKLIQQHRHRVGAIAKRHSQQYNYSASRYDPPRRTGVVGICMAFEYQKRCLGNVWYPGFVLSYADKAQGIQRTSSRKITRARGLTDTWRETCQVLAKWRGYKRVPTGWYAQCPTHGDFNKLRLWYCKNGKHIPVANMQHIDKCL